MLICKLTPQFFEENSSLKEVLDREKGVWVGEKTRGYGIVLIDYKSLRFGLPLRTSIKHHYCFQTEDSKGLDYSKAVLLQKDGYISDQPFKIPQDEFLKIANSTHHIGQMFSKYVSNYVRGVLKADQNILRQYRFSTLQNYHKELGVD
ncbi:MAG: hypothetical protein BGP24_22425 [Lysobacterales bacterium 69-70]|nr:hypothetical protein [Xanthomonadaceae bacterium]ODU36514.1 MAG: hypothetical protein ABS97_01145 [Xanthomonadaceae bacterium SCN 69-320]ODV17040.1 MAG: hypothetical protein ABT27_18260 [Xanthomonadaceae bacterium SCN 69-25]OJY96333.1 MAG: hypothetical protein BGP24_22425 [Xanthomonadales bacterium 69-70]